MTLVPAYGRDYKSKAGVLVDWNANKDFQATGYINKEQVVPGTSLTFRYKRLTSVFLHTST